MRTLGYCGTSWQVLWRPRVHSAAAARNGSDEGGSKIEFTAKWLVMSRGCWLPGEAAPGPSLHEIPNGSGGGYSDSCCSLLHCRSRVSSSYHTHSTWAPIVSCGNAEVADRPVEVFKFATYLFIPLFAMLHFGDPNWCVLVPYVQMTDSAGMRTMFTPYVEESKVNAV